MKVNKNIKNDIEKTAKSFFEAGGKIDINYGLPYIAIDQPNGENYYFQEDEASEMLKDIPDNVNDKDYFAWYSRHF
jgi:hypothetical protein